MRFLLFVALSLALSACGSGGSNDSWRAKRAITAEDQARADAIELRLTDLPTGWHEQKSYDEDRRCADLNFADLTISGKADGPIFSRNAAHVNSTASIFQTEDQAGQAFIRVASDTYMGCIEDAMAEARKDLRVTNSSHGSLTFPSLGERSVAYQIEVDFEAKGLSPSSYVDAVVIQSGRAVALVLFGGAGSSTPFDKQDEERLARAVSERMET